MTSKEKLYVVKIGGNVIDNEHRLSQFLRDLSALQSKKILVHGGGKLATKLAEELQIPQQLVDGRRITDAETLKIVTMVYAGYINKNIVAQLQSNGTNAIGLCGADASMIKAHRRISSNIDYGFVGDIDHVNHDLINSFLQQDLTLVVAPVTDDGKGQLLNTNADTIAQSIATSMSRVYEVELIYTFEKAGVLLDIEDETSVIPTLNPEQYAAYREGQNIFAGMIPKIDNAFAAIGAGVHKVIIGKAESLLQLTSGSGGTTILA